MEMSEDAYTDGRDLEAKGQRTQDTVATKVEHQDPLPSGAGSPGQRAECPVLPL